MKLWIVRIAFFVVVAGLITILALYASHRMDVEFGFKRRCIIQNATYVHDVIAYCNALYQQQGDK